MKKYGTLAHKFSCRSPISRRCLSTRTYAPSDSDVIELADKSCTVNPDERKIQHQVDELHGQIVQVCYLLRISLILGSLRNLFSVQ